MFKGLFNTNLNILNAGETKDITLISWKLEGKWMRNTYIYRYIEIYIVYYFIQYVVYCIYKSGNPEKHQPTQFAQGNSAIIMAWALFIPG